MSDKIVMKFLHNYVTEIIKFKQPKSSSFEEIKIWHTYSKIHFVQIASKVKI